MGPASHAVLAAVTGAAVWAAGAGLDGGVAAFVSGTLIDADHLLDYVLSEGLQWNLDAIRTGSYFKKADRAVVLLHSYELIALCSAACWLAGRNRVGVGLFAGAMVHVASDTIFYDFTPIAYFLLYRGANRFHLDAFKRVQLSLRRSSQSR
jgi:hypothetical protein